MIFSHLNIDILIFVVIQFITVIISTIKSILTVNGSKFSASVVNAISYTFGAIIIKLTPKQDFAVVIFVAMFTNLLGVWIAKWILEKFERDKIWTYSALVSKNEVSEIEKKLKERGINFAITPALNNRMLINLYSFSKIDSVIIKEILNNINYVITENR